MKVYEFILLLYFLLFCTLINDIFSCVIVLLFLSLYNQVQPRSSYQFKELECNGEYR